MPREWRDEGESAVQRSRMGNMNKPKIAIDGQPALWPRTGIGTITCNVLKHIQATDPESDYIAYVDADPSTLIGHHGPAVRVFGRAQHELLWSNWYVPRQIRRDEIDVFITFRDKEIPFIPLKSKIISMVHDLIPLRFPEIIFRNAAHRVYYKTLIRASIQRADRILTNSEYSKQEIVNEFGVDERKVHKLTLGVDRSAPTHQEYVAAVLRRYKLTRPYLVALGSTEPRKNNARVIEAMRLLAPAHPELRLVIIGKNWRGIEFDQKLLDSYISLTGTVSDAEMSAIVGSAEMLVFPSLHEGFGFPVIEAMSLGLPVVTSNSTALPEVGADAALYVDPYSVPDIANKVERVLSDSALATSMRNRGLEHAASFRWETTCAEIAAICSELLSEGR